MAQPSSYQRVGATAADYDASVAPIAAKFDGVDDALASATFTANTVLTSGMTALMAVRRDALTNFTVLVYEAGGGAPYFGFFEPSGGAGCFAGAGTPTTWVDGVPLAGGTATTTGTLAAALTLGAWHILEMRGMDLSAWTKLSTGNFALGYQLPGAIGEIMLFANPSESDLNQARAQMAAYFGVTLP